MTYTKIIHPVRIALGITPYDYFLLDMIARSQTNPNYSKNGWCTLSYLKIAEWIGVSDKGIRKSSVKVQELGLLEINGTKKRVSSLWFSAFEDISKAEQSTAQNRYKVPLSEVSENDKSGTKYRSKAEQSTAQNRYKVPLKAEQSTALNKKVNLKGNINVFGAKNESHNSEVNSNKRATSTEKKKSSAKKRKEDVLFSETEYYTAPGKFKLEFGGTDWEVADLGYYFECVKSWADSKGEKRRDWIATARQFMLRDRRDGKLVLNSKFKNHEKSKKSAINIEQAERLAGL